MTAIRRGQLAGEAAAGKATGEAATGLSRRAGGNPGWRPRGDVWVRVASSYTLFFVGVLRWLGPDSPLQVRDEQQEKPP